MFSFVRQLICALFPLHLVEFSSTQIKYSGECTHDWCSKFQNKIFSSQTDEFYKQKWKLTNGFDIVCEKCLAGKS